MPVVSQLLLHTCVLGFCLLLAGCPEEEPIRVGYVGGLTGRVAGLGVAGRDGALLAIEDQNQRGGIDGRRLILVARDDRQDPEIAKQVIDELIAADVVAIIGPMTSSMAVAMLPLVNQAGIVMISPTVKTDMLSAQDDYFFRVTTPLSINAGKIAGLAVGELGLKRFAVVYDESNLAFTKTWLDSFKSFAEPLGGHFVAIESFHSGPEVSFLNLAENIIVTDPQGILVLASAMDTALFSQQVRKLGSNAPMFTSEWAFTSDVIDFGGQAVDGMAAYHSFNADCQVTAYLAFKQDFERRFGYQPSFATVLSHDAAHLLITALKQDPDPTRLKMTLLGIGDYQGLQSDFRLDRYGDVKRQLFLTLIHDGRFKVVDSQGSFSPH